MTEEGRKKLMNTCNKVLTINKSLMSDPKPYQSGASVSDPMFYQEVERVLYDIIDLENEVKRQSDLLKEKQAEIERLNEKIEQKCDACADGMLKAEQPRLMRLPEAMGIYDPVFAEYKKMDGDTFTKWVDAVISDDARHVKVTDLYCIIPTIREMEFDFNLYNKRFRFWSKKPTDEQMESEPWD